MNHPSKTKKVLYGGFAALGLTMGAAGLAAAATNQTAPKPPAANTEHGADVGDQRKPGFRINENWVLGVGLSLDG